MTIYGLQTKTIVFSDGPAGGAEEIVPLNREKKITFSYDKPGELFFSNPISLEGGSTAALEVELALEDGTPQDGPGYMIYGLSLVFHDGATQTNGHIAYFQQNDGLE